LELLWFVILDELSPCWLVRLYTIVHVSMDDCSEHLDRTLDGFTVDMNAVRYASGLHEQSWWTQQSQKSRDRDLSQDVDVNCDVLTCCVTMYRLNLLFRSRQSPIL
jgi:hypothetical protein